MKKKPARRARPTAAAMRALELRVAAADNLAADLSTRLLTARAALGRAERVLQNNGFRAPTGPDGAWTPKPAAVEREPVEAPARVELALAGVHVTITSKDRNPVT